MNFAKKALKRIVVSSLVISIAAGFIGWRLTNESLEKETVNLALEVSQGTISHFNLKEASPEQLLVLAKQVTDRLLIDWFDIAELYDKNGNRIAESRTPSGDKIEKVLPPHEIPNYQEPFYKSNHIDYDIWVLSTFIPLKEQGVIWGYLEGVRVVPDWQRADIRNFALLIALMAAGAAWLCALIIYPLILFLNRENQCYIGRIKDANTDMMFTMGKAIALRDSDTGAHNYRVAWLATELAEAYGMEAESFKSLILGSYLHDVGKIAISDGILLKPGKLTPEEMEVMKTHVLEGVKMVDGIAWLSNAKTVIEAHHEKWNGNGYPHKLSGQNIPISARIFSIVDVFDALCSKRPYKEPFSYDKALSIIKESSGSHFDPELVVLFECHARRLYDTIIHADEETCRTLMLEKIDRYFYF